MNVTAKRLTETDELFMDAYNSLNNLFINLQSLPQNKTPENRVNLIKATDDLIERLHGLREHDR